MTKKKRVHADFQDFILEQLQDPLAVAAYLKEAAADEDKDIFLMALRNVVLARCKSIANLAKKTKLNEQNLHRMLSKKGNPRFNSLKAVLKETGVQISFTPLTK